MSYVKCMQYILLVVFSVFSSFVMSYIALATMIGPWMGPTLILIALLLSPLIRCTSEQLLLPVIGAAVGGIIATGMSSAFSTYYFLDKASFMYWMTHFKDSFSAMIFLIATAGLVAFTLVYYIEKYLIEDQKLAFPIGKLVYDIAESSDTKQSKKQLVYGFLSTIVYLMINTCMRYSIAAYQGCITLLSKCSYYCITVPAISFDMELLPMFLSIGFIAGSSMTVPLLLGSFLKILCVDTVHTTYFSYLSSMDFLLAFCSGLVVSGACISLIDTPKRLWTFFNKPSSVSLQNYSWKKMIHPLPIIALIMAFVCFKKYGFSSLEKLYIILFTCICIYQMVVIAGKIGLAFLGRFATFIMMPGLVFFGWTGLQATIVATFVELCGGTATELLFGYKTASCAQLDRSEVRRFQMVGIIISACSVALAFWLLVTHFQLGSEQLFAQRAQSRSLLIQAGQFDIMVVAIGCIMGLVLHVVKINTMLILGGLLMTPSMVLPLVFGGLLSRYIYHKERFEPLCSGIYATVSLWMIFNAL